MRPITTVHIPPARNAQAPRNRPGARPSGSNPPRRRQKHHGEKGAKSLTTENGYFDESHTTLSLNESGTWGGGGRGDRQEEEEGEWRCVCVCEPIPGRRDGDDGEGVNVGVGVSKL
jgi:hypothetical protein